MLQNFHHTLYISDYNVSPMEICSTIVRMKVLVSVGLDRCVTPPLVT
jgi:hypothetical protein